jgi:uncharacterized protein YjiS (DUF1127 family)
MRPFTTVSSSHPAHFGLTHAVAQFFVSRWRKYGRQRRLKATIRLLQRLDDRSLKDIGLSRSEIEPVVHHLPDRRHHRHIDLYGITPRG